MARRGDTHAAPLSCSADVRLRRRARPRARLANQAAAPPLVLVLADLASCFRWHAAASSIRKKNSNHLGLRIPTIQKCRQSFSDIGRSARSPRGRPTDAMFELAKESARTADLATGDLPRVDYFARDLFLGEPLAGANASFEGNLQPSGTRGRGARNPFSVAQPTRPTANCCCGEEADNVSQNADHGHQL